MMYFQFFLGDGVPIPVLPSGPQISFVFVHSSITNLNFIAYGTKYEFKSGGI